MSRCHEAQGEWMPEVGSKEYQKRWDGMAPTFEPGAVDAFGHAVSCMARKRPVVIPVPKVIRKRGTKYHWASNDYCSHVVRVEEGRVLGGDEFNALAKFERCFCCDYHFVNA